MSPSERTDLAPTAPWPRWLLVLMGTAAATITIAGRTLHADAAAVDMYAAIDLLADKLDRLMKEHRSKQVDHHRGESAARSDSFG